MTESKAEYIVTDDPKFDIKKFRKEFSALRNYAAFRAAEEDKIGVQKIYVDIAGDIKAALVLDELIFWTLPRENKISGLRVWKDGVLWLAVNRSEWWERKRLTERQADTAINKLVEQGLVIKELYKFNATPTVHLRLNIPAFFQKYSEALNELHPPEIEENTIEKDLADLYEMLGFHQNVKSTLQNGDTDSPKCNTDSPNGEILNIPHTTQTQPKQTRDGEKPAKPKASDFPELVLFKDMALTYCKPQQREIVIKAVKDVEKRLGHFPTKEDLQPFWDRWCHVSGNAYNLSWLTEWAVSGVIPNGSPGPKPAANIPQGAAAAASWLAKKQQEQTNVR